jgi:hypothetical protein
MSEIQKPTDEEMKRVDAWRGRQRGLKSAKLLTPEERRAKARDAAKRRWSATLTRIEQDRAMAEHNRAVMEHHDGKEASNESQIT